MDGDNNKSDVEPASKSEDVSASTSVRNDGDKISNSESSDETNENIQIPNAQRIDEESIMTASTPDDDSKADISEESESDEDSLAILRRKAMEKFNEEALRDPIVIEHSPNCSTCGDLDSSVNDDGNEDDDDDNGKAFRYDWTTLMIRTGITTAMYPSQMVQMLMQIGYEPFPPRCSVTLLGRPCLLLPSTAGYVRHIYQVDGLQGVFRGLIPRIAHQLLYTSVYDRVRLQLRRMHLRYLMEKARQRVEAETELTISNLNGFEIECRPTFHSSSMPDISEESDCPNPGFWDHLRETIHEITSKLVATAVSYPLHVIVVRTLSHFVGREHFIRDGIFGEVKAIYSDFGIWGFYRGIVPKLLCETSQTLAVGALAYFVSNQAPSVEVRSMLNLSFSILVSAWTYPFNVVSTTMIVNGSSLAAGNPPIQPKYNNWVQCWKEIGKLNLLNRGSSFICRYYTGPTYLVNGLKVPTGIYFGPNHLLASQTMLRE